MTGPMYTLVNYSQSHTHQSLVFRRFVVWLDWMTDLWGEKITIIIISSSTLTSTPILNPRPPGSPPLPLTKKKKKIIFPLFPLSPPNGGPKKIPPFLASTNTKPN